MKKTPSILKYLFNLENLSSYFKTEKKKETITTGNLALTAKKFVIILDGKVVLPGVYTEKALDEYRKMNMFQSGLISAWEIGNAPVAGGLEEMYVETGELSPESKKFLDDMFTSLGTKFDPENAPVEPMRTND